MGCLSKEMHYLFVDTDFAYCIQIPEYYCRYTMKQLSKGITSGISVKCVVGNERRRLVGVLICDLSKLILLLCFGLWCLS